MQRDACGLSWFWISLPHFQIWNRNVRKRDSFIGSLRHIEPLSSSAWPKLGSGISGPAYRKEIVRGRRLVHRLSGFGPEEERGGLLTFLRWDHGCIPHLTAREAGEWSASSHLCVGLQVSLRGRWGEWSVVGSQQSICDGHHAGYLQKVCTLMKFTLTWGGLGMDCSWVQGTKRSSGWLERGERGRVWGQRSH